MAKGFCSKCKISLTEESCRPAVLKAGSGYCYSCTKIHRRGHHDRDPEKFKYTILKSNAKKTKQVVEISLDEYRTLVRNKPCLYCGGSLSVYIYGYGLDRVDHQKGYITGNCVPCCWSCNSLKGRLEGLGFPPSRAVELLRELNKIREADKHHGYNPSRSSKPSSRNRIF